MPFSTKVNKLSHRWDELNKELGELEQAMVPWRQLLDSRDALEHFLTPLEELFEVECANANQLPLGSDFTPFIVQFKVLIIGFICTYVHMYEHTYLLPTYIRLHMCDWANNNGPSGHNLVFYIVHLHSVSFKTLLIKLFISV